MTHEIITHVRRTIWISECPACGERKETADQPPRERLCMRCRQWVPYEKIEYTGPDTRR